MVTEVEPELAVGSYQPTPADMEGIARGLANAEAGLFATEGEIEAIFAKYRRA